MVNTMVSPDAMNDLQIWANAEQKKGSSHRRTRGGFQDSHPGQVICPPVLCGPGKNDSRSLTPHSPLKHGLLPRHKMALC